MRKLLLLLSVFFIQISMVSQNNIPSKDEIAVAKQVEALRVAMVDVDANQLRALTSNQLSYGHSGGHIENQEEFIEKIVSGKSNFVTIDLQDQTISISKDIAIVRHKLLAHTNDGGVEKDIELGIMLIWQKHKKEWLLIARQAFKLPVKEKK